MSQLTLDEQRAAIEATGGDLPDDTTVVPVDAGGVGSEWVSTHDTDARLTVVALRGGGYCLGSLASNRRFCALLSQTARCAVLNVGFGNAPEHPYPSALHDALAAYRWLVATGTDPATIVLAGNSAGGGLVLTCLLALRDAGDALPAGAIALSPWTDLAGTGESIVSNAATEVLLDPFGVRATAELYADASQLTDPYVSPLYGELHDLPPLLVHVSDAEILLDDALRFVDKARRVGVNVTLDIETGVPHVWHLFAGLLPEADRALTRVGDWLRQTVQPAAALRDTI